MQVSSTSAEQKSKLRKLVGRLRGSSLKSTPVVAIDGGERFVSVGHIERAPRDTAGRPDLDVADPVPQEPSHSETGFSEQSGDRVGYIDTEEDSWRKQTCASALNTPNSDIPVSTPGYPELNFPLAVKVESLAEQTNVAPNTPVQETTVVRPVKLFGMHTESNQIPVLVTEKPEVHVQTKQAFIEERETLGSPTTHEQKAGCGTLAVDLLGRGGEKSKFKEDC